MSNRIDGQIDDIFRLLGMIDEYGAYRICGVEFTQEMTREELERRYPCSEHRAQSADNVRVQDEVRREIEEKRLAQLERESGCNDV